MTRERLPGLREEGLRLEPRWQRSRGPAQTGRAACRADEGSFLGQAISAQQHLTSGFLGSAFPPPPLPLPSSC